MGETVDESLFNKAKINMKGGIGNGTKEEKIEKMVEGSTK